MSTEREARLPCPETMCAMWTTPQRTSAEDAAFIEGARQMKAALAPPADAAPAKATPEPAKAAVTDAMVSAAQAALNAAYDSGNTTRYSMRAALEAALSATPPEAATKPAFDAYWERPNGEPK